MDRADVIILAGARIMLPRTGVLVSQAQDAEPAASEGDEAPTCRRLLPAEIQTMPLRSRRA